MAKAQLFEDRNDDFTAIRKTEEYRSNWTPKPTNSSPSIPIRAPITGPVSSSQNTSVPPFSPPSGVSKIPVKKLSPAEMKDRRDKGLCYTCDEKFHHGHMCKNRMMIMCVYDTEDSDSEELIDHSETEEIAEEEVSLNSLLNSLNPRIFRILAKQGGKSVHD